VCHSSVNGVWRNIFPDVVTDFHGFDDDGEEIGSLRRAIIDMARTVGFEDIDVAIVQELFKYHTKVLCSENPQELEKELNDEDDASSDVKPVTCLSTEQPTEFLKHIDTAFGITGNNDGIRDRSAKVTTAVVSTVAFCKELYSGRQKAACQLCLHHFFRRVESCQSTGSERDLVQSDHAPRSPTSD
jgi:hypothetical protein